MRRNLLRGIAVALIILPEPFTTPIGAALLAVSFLLPKQHKDNLSNLENLVKRYTHYKEANGFNRLSELKKQSVYHRLKRPNITSHVTPVHEYIDRKTRAEFQRNYRIDSRKPSDQLVRNIWRAGLSQYSANSPRTRTNITLHTLKSHWQKPAVEKSYSRMMPIVRAPKPKLVHHTLTRV